MGTDDSRLMRYKQGRFIHLPLYRRVHFGLIGINIALGYDVFGGNVSRKQVLIQEIRAK